MAGQPLEGSALLKANSRRWHGAASPFFAHCMRGMLEKKGDNSCDPPSVCLALCDGVNLQLKPPASLEACDLPTAMAPEGVAIPPT